MNKDRVAELVAFMEARHDIYLRRAAGQPKPWTDDAVLRNYRFCNVYRELDSVSVWIRENIMEPYAHHPHLWFALAVARQINWPETLGELLEEKALLPTLNGRWDPMKTRKVMLARQARGEKVYTGAYMLTAMGRAANDPPDKPHYTCVRVLLPVWQGRSEVQEALQTAQPSLEGFHAALLPHKGWGSFVAAQVVADVKHTRQLKDAVDWWTWAASGPGSRRGLNLIVGREPEAPWREADWLRALQFLREEVNSLWTSKHEPLCAQNMQNCLCEFFKYKRGWSRSTYQGT